MPAKPLPSTGITVREAAEALGVTRQALEERIKKGRLVPLAGSNPIALNRTVIESEIRERLAEARSHLAALERGASSLAVEAAEIPLQAIANPARDQSAAPQSGELVRLRAALAEAETGRALAEAKIDELIRDVRRLNNAVDALKPQPDFDPDIVA
jgi:hypothetical protein